MEEQSGRWVQVTPSGFAWEREALAYLKGRLPDQEPYRVWANFEFITNAGAIYEVDFVALTPRGFFVGEIKSRPGTLGGDQTTWRWKTDGKRRLDDNPILLTNRKAKALKSLLMHTDAGRKLQQQRRFPYVAPLVFLSAKGLKVELTGPALTGLYGRGTLGRLEDVVDFLSTPDPHQVKDPSRRVTTAVAQLLADAMEQAGLRRSRRSLRAGDFELGRMLTNGPGFQDFEASNLNLPSVRKRVRIYAHQRGSSEETRRNLQRAAEREALVLEGLKHPGVLKVDGFTTHELGPALIFEHDPEAQRLDHWLAEHGEGLTLDARIGIVRQLADVLRYAHSRRVAHRALSPQAVLVAGAPGDPQVKVFSWQSASQLGSGTPASSALGLGRGLGLTDGTSRLDALVDEVAAAYMAPEALTNPSADRVALDVFSLGALAYLVFTGQPPATNGVDLLRALRDGNGLQLPAALDGAGEGLRALVADATRPEVRHRYDSVEWFLTSLDEAQADMLPPDSAVEVTHPEDARPGDQLGDYTVVRPLGRGSTAVALLVHDPEGRERVLKVALDERMDDRIVEEFEALDGLSDRNIVHTYAKTAVAGRQALVLGKAGDESLARLLRREGSVGLGLLQRWGDDLLAAVGYLEQMGRAHRDIKPDNLGVVKRGRDEVRHLVLFDFSLSRAPVMDIRAGTPPYLEPFLVDRPQRRWDTAAERFAAAVTLYEMATGVQPRWGDGGSAPEAIADEVTVEADRLPAAVREPLAAFFARSLRRAPEDRFDTADDMRKAWDRAFADADQPPVSPTPTPGHEVVDLEAVVATLQPSSSLAESGLAQRALELLERLDVVTVTDLVATPANTIQFGSGLGSEVRNRILDLRLALRRRFPDLVAAPPPEGPRKQRQPADDDRRGRRPVGPAVPVPVAGSDVDVQALDRLVAQLLPDPGRRGSRDRGVVHRLFGLDGPAPAAPTSVWPSQTELAAALGISAQRVSQVLAKQRGLWAGNASLARVRGEVGRLLDNMGGVATVAELAVVVASLRGTDDDVDDPVVLGRAALRAACEVETDAPEPRWVQRRAGDKVVLAAEPLTADEADDDADDTGTATATARSEWAVRLGRAADEIAAADPLLSPAMVLSRLRAVIPPPGMLSLADTRLVRLAASVSAGAAVSSRMELYPQGLDPRRALRLAQNALLAPRIARGTVETRLSEDDIEERLRSRYPEMADLPGRPDLDRLLEDADVPLRWYEPEDDLEAGYAMTPLPGGLTSLGRGSTGKSTGPSRPPAEVADATHERLTKARARGGFLALTVAPKRMEPAAERLAAMGMTRVSVEGRLLVRLHEQAEANRVAWPRVIEADAAGPAGPAWRRLAGLMTLAWPLVDADVRAAGPEVLLTELGPLARYGAMGWVDRWRDATLDPGSGLRSVWLLLPAGSHQPPVIDGQVVPVVDNNQWGRLASRWLEAGRSGGRGGRTTKGSSAVTETD